MRLCHFLLVPLCLVPWFPAIAQPAEPAAQVIVLPLPWKQGQVLRYESEQVETKTRPGSREKSRIASMTEVTTVAAGKDGFVQRWRGYDSRTEVLEGDATLAKAFDEASLQLEDLALEVEMDAAGTYRRLRNLDQVATRMREVLRPVMLSAFAAGVEKGLQGAAPAKRTEVVDGIPAQVDALVARLTEPKLLEQMLTGEIQTVLNFSGAELEDGESYVLESELENPTGGRPFPATLTFGLYEDEDEPEDVWLEWTLEIDPVKGAAAVWEAAERMFGKALTAEERKTLPDAVSIVDKGFLLFHRQSGLPELFENERTTKVAEAVSYKRNRMRLVDNPHGHEWRAQTAQATEAELTAAERDAQLCATEDADIPAAIAACSRALADEDIVATAKDRARWLAARAQHHLRDRKHDAALADFDRAIALLPAQADLYIERSRAHGMAGSMPAALADAQRAVRLAPASAQARVLVGVAHERLQQWSRAIAAYDKAAELAPEAALPFDARCWAKAMAGDFDGGRADCDRALALRPDSWNSYNSRGYIHYRKGEHAAAIRDYGTALEHEPGVASSWYMRGMARRAAGDEAGAGADIAKGLELDAGIAERYAGYGVK